MTIHHYNFLHATLNCTEIIKPTKILKHIAKENSLNYKN
jgi:hypothetical protein